MRSPPPHSVHTNYIWFIRLEEQLVVIRGTVGIHRNADCLYKNTFTTQNTYIVNQKLEHYIVSVLNNLFCSIGSYDLIKWFWATIKSPVNRNSLCGTSTTSLHMQIIIYGACKYNAHIEIVRRIWVFQSWWNLELRVFILCWYLKVFTYFPISLCKILYFQNCEMKFACSRAANCNYNSNYGIFQWSLYFW
jgi:hypothetical protein